MKRRLFIALLIVLGVATVTLGLIGRDRIVITWELMRVHRVIAAGEQGWATDAQMKLDQLDRKVGDKRLLARKLLEEKDGSLVAEGLWMMHRHDDPLLTSNLQRFAKDDRWTWELVPVGTVCGEIASLRSTGSSGQRSN